MINSIKKISSIGVLAIIYLALTCIIPGTVFAFGEYNLGGSLNPINVQISQSPETLQRQENLSKESQLKSEYGSTRFYLCKSSACGSFDAGDPFTYSSCLNMTEAWLRANRCQDQKTYTNTTPPPVSKTKDQVCQDSFGIYSEWNGTVNSNNELGCRCKIGYSSNDAGTSICLLTTVVPTKTNDQICQTDFGINSAWDGTKNSNGGLNCNCKTGYSWKDDNNKKVCVLNVVSGGGGGYQVQQGTLCNGTYYSSCAPGNDFVCPSIGEATCNHRIVTPKVVSSPSIQKEKVAQFKKVNVSEATTTAGVAATSSNVITSNIESVATATTTEKIIKKGFWQKFKGWFGF